jgi:signal peptidase I
MKAFSREVLGILILAMVIFLLVQVIIPKAVVRGSSMEPNLHDGQKVLVNKMAYLFSEPRRGDVIVFTPPDTVASDYDYIKRIIGLPGEVVEIKEGIVYVHQSDGNILTLDEQEYIIDPARNYYISQEIPPNSYFVLGDNRNNSSDSRGGWTVSREDIVGRAWLSIWPVSEWGLVLNYSFP